MKSGYYKCRDCGGNGSTVAVCDLCGETGNCQWIED